jgi:uncharacterized protein (PEP-CTERM system associated)
MTVSAVLFGHLKRGECRLAVLATALLFAQLCVHAQGVPLQPVAADAPPRNYWIEPRVSVGLSVANTGGGSTGANAVQALEFSPGVRWVANTARVRGSLDYTLRTLRFTGGGSYENVRHQLRGNATFNAWDNRAFVDLASVADGRSISALGAPPTGSLTNTNEAETSTFLFSPYLRGPLNPSMDYEVRYSAQVLRTAADNRSDIDVSSATARLASSQTASLFGWSLDASSVRVDYALNRSSHHDSLGGQVSYAIFPELRVFLLAGTESEDIAQQTQVRSTTSGLGFDWRSSPRTRAFARLEKRYFGNAHDVLLEHRTGRTTWRFTDTRNVADSLVNAASGSQGSLRNALDARLALIEPDPVARARLVDAELLKLGLPADTEVFTNLLTSAATVFRTQEVSVILEGTRSLFALALSNSKSTRLGTVVTLGDDFDNGATIRTKGWSVSASHRFTPLSTGTLVFKRQSNSSSVAGAANTVDVLTVGLTTRLGLRTSADMRLRHTRSDLRANETAVSTMLTHRF